MKGSKEANWLAEALGNGCPQGWPLVNHRPIQPTIRLMSNPRQMDIIHQSIQSNPIGQTDQMDTKISPHRAISMLRIECYESAASCASTDTHNSVDIN